MEKSVSIFDVIGPVIIGPSSSHTAGAVKIGLLAQKLYQHQPKKVRFVLYNSFAKTGKGHGTDKGLVAGLLGMGVGDTAIKNAFDIAKNIGLEYEFCYEDDFSRHPNSVDIIFLEPNKMTVKGESLGGGEAMISYINQYKVDIRGDYHTLMLIYKDVPGMVYKISKFIQDEKVNIASLTCERSVKGEEASMCICLDSPLSKATIEKLSTVEDVFLFRNIEAIPK